MTPTRLNIGFANWDALIWKESSVLQVIQWSYILACGLSWLAEACVERAECVCQISSFVIPSLLLSVCPWSESVLPSSTFLLHDSIPLFLCTLTGPFALSQCGGVMHPYVCFVYNWRCVYMCAVVLSAAMIYWHQCISWLVAACTLQLIHHPLDPMLPLTGLMLIWEWIICLIAYLFS